MLTDSERIALAVLVMVMRQRGPKTYRVVTDGISTVIDLSHPLNIVEKLLKRSKRQAAS